MKRIKLEQLKKNAERMPDGYIDSILSVATLEEDGTVVAISDEDFVRLHSPQVPQVIPNTATPTQTPPPIKQPEPPLPSMPQMAANLARATVSQIAGGMQTRTEEEAQAVVKEFCEPCENYRASDGRCAKCGCFLATKTAWKSQHCPVGKW